MKALLLLSGGLDSPVAGYLMQQQGYTVDAIHFSLEPITDDGPEKKSLACAKKLKLKKVYTANIAKAAAIIAKEAEHKYYFVLTKRLMLHAAQTFAQQKGYDALITGESLGQVSSQTLANLKAITHDAKMPILRPLLTRDKLEIIKIAKAIDTYDVATGPEVCDALGPKSPATKAKVATIIREEEKYNKDELIKEILTSCKEVIV